MSFVDIYPSPRVRFLCVVAAIYPVRGILCLVQLSGDSLMCMGRLDLGTF